jgi:hypothetical protein
MVFLPQAGSAADAAGPAVATTDAVVRELLALAPM